MKIKELESYEAVKKWLVDPFGKRCYRRSTETMYLNYLATLCDLAGKTPDELAHLNGNDALKLQVELAIVMKEKLRLRETSITHRINAMHCFWRANGIFL